MSRIILPRRNLILPSKRLQRGSMILDAYRFGGGGGTDDFSTNTLSSYTEYANSSISWVISGGVLSCSSGSGTKQSILTRNGVTFADGEVSCVISVADDAGLVLRLVDNNNYYVAAISDASAVIGAGNKNKVKLYKRVAGTFTQLGTTQSISFTRGTPQTFSLSAAGTTLTVKFNGSALITTTDASLTTGKCGPRSDSNRATFDSFTWP